MQSQQSFGWIDSKRKIHTHFTRISWIFLPLAQSCKGRTSLCVFKLLSKRTCTSTLGMGSLALMRPITLLNIQISFCLQLLRGTSGGTVCLPHNLDVARHKTYVPDRRSGSLDASVQRNDQHHCLFCRLGQRHESSGLASSDHDRSQLRANECT